MASSLSASSTLLSPCTVALNHMHTHFHGRVKASFYSLRKERCLSSEAAGAVASEHLGKTPDIISSLSPQNSKRHHTYTCSAFSGLFPPKCCVSVICWHVIKLLVCFSLDCERQFSCCSAQKRNKIVIQVEQTHKCRISGNHEITRV